MTRPPCTCPEHRDGAPVELDGHTFRRGGGDEFGWYWTCSCGGRGRLTLQSDNVPYHAWTRHVLKRRGRS